MEELAESGSRLEKRQAPVKTLWDHRGMNAGNAKFVHATSFGSKNPDPRSNYATQNWKEKSRIELWMEGPCDDDIPAGSTTVPRFHNVE